jgi:hypothetical protein
LPINSNLLWQSSFAGFFVKRGYIKEPGFGAADTGSATTYTPIDFVIPQPHRTIGMGYRSPASQFIITPEVAKLFGELVLIIVRPARTVLVNCLSIESLGTPVFV